MQRRETSGPPRSLPLRIGDAVVSLLAPQGEARAAAVARQSELILPDEILKKIDFLRPGAGEAVRGTLANILKDQPENDVRMYLSGVVAGAAVVGIQNGEKFLRMAGLPDEQATVVTVTLQAIAASLINGIRWPASRTYHTLNTHITPIVGGDLARIIESSGVSLGNRAKDVREIVKAIGEGFSARETNERFGKYINGFATGILVGSCMTLDPIGGVVGAGITIGLNSALDRAYPIMLGKRARDLGEAMVGSREVRDLVVSYAQVSRGGVASFDYERQVAPVDDVRRAVADEKNYKNYLWSSLLPIIAAACARLGAPGSTLATYMYTYAQIVNAVMNRLESSSNMEAQKIAGVSALDELRQLVAEAVEIQARFAGVIDQKVTKNMRYPKSFNGKEATELVYELPNPLKVARFTNRAALVEQTELVLDKPIELWPGEATLVIGKEQVGKTSLLDSIARIRELGGKVTLVPKESDDYSLRKELARLVLGGEQHLGCYGHFKINDLVTGRDDVLEFNEIVDDFARLAESLGIERFDKSWLSKDRRLSGEQQLLMNTILAFLQAPSEEGERSIILFDDPMGVLTISGKQKWIVLVNTLMKWQRDRHKAGGPSLICAANDVGQEKNTLTSNDLGTWLELPGLNSVIDLSRRKTVELWEIKSVRMHRMADILSGTGDVKRSVEERLFSGKFNFELLIEALYSSLEKSSFGDITEVISKRCSTIKGGINLFSAPIGVGLDWLADQMSLYCWSKEWLLPNEKSLGEKGIEDIFKRFARGYFGLRLAMNELSESSEEQEPRQSKRDKIVPRLVSPLITGIFDSYSMVGYNVDRQRREFTLYLTELANKVYEEMYGPSKV